MTKDTFIITLPPQQLRQLQGWRATPAHLAYRVGRGPRLLRAGGPPPSGGLMVVDNRGFDGLGPAGPFCQEVFRECQARNFSGVVLDFEGRLPPLVQMAAALDDGLSRRGLALYVPEAYGHCTRQARVMISSALSGGSLSARLEEAAEHFGRDRLVLALERTAEDFPLPSPTGSGVPLSREELIAQIARLRPAVFFSSELCARYFTYMSRENGAHFVLFDDMDTLRRKVEVAHGRGISSFLIPWAELEERPEHLGLQRLPAPVKK